MATPQVSVFDASHAVQIIFPSDEPIRDQPDALVVTFPATRSNKRYEPLPLVPDDVATTIHTDKTDPADSAFYVLNPVDEDAQLPTAEQLEAKMRRWQITTRDVRCLFRDMAIVTSFVGHTNLDAVFFRPDTQLEAPSDANITVLRFKRSTTFRVKGGAIVHVEHFYDLSRDEMFDFECLLLDAGPWAAALRDLLWQNSDRAVRHVRAQLRKMKMDGAVSVWKPRRCPPYLDALQSVTSMPALNAVAGETCPSCLELYNAEDRQAMVLACHQAHRMCRGCLVEWCQTRGAVAAACIQCRSRLFTDSRTVDFLTYGVSQTDGKTYEPDSRYTDHENFTRSVADLDQRLASNNADEMRGDNDILFAALRHIIDGERSETEKSTPLDLQMARRPERSLIINSIAESLKCLQGHNYPTSTAYNYITDKVYHDFVQSYSQRGIMSYYTDAEMTVMAGPDRGKIPLPPDFRSFLNRTVSRMLQFWRVRRCDCGAGTTHLHGLRLYYEVAEELSAE